VAAPDDVVLEVVPKLAGDAEAHAADLEAVLGVPLVIAAGVLVVDVDDVAQLELEVGVEAEGAVLALQEELARRIPGGKAFDAHQLAAPMGVGHDPLDGRIDRRGADLLVLNS